MKRIVVRGGVVGIACAVVAAWLFLPGSFGHGVIVGFFVAIGVVLGGLAVFIKAMEKKRSSTQLEPPHLPATSWDYNMALQDLSGRPFTFDAGTVIVLNFWATWCSPCIAELPSLQRLLTATADLDVRFGFITSEKASTVQQFVEKRGVDLPMYTLSGEPPDCFKGRGIPVTFVIDRTGMIALRHFGAAAWDAERVVAFVRGLAAKPMP